MYTCDLLPSHPSLLALHSPELLLASCRLGFLPASAKVASSPPPHHVGPLVWLPINNNPFLHQGSHQASQDVLVAGSALPRCNRRPPWNTTTVCAASKCLETFQSRQLDVDVGQLTHLPSTTPCCLTSPCFPSHPALSPVVRDGVHVLSARRVTLPPFLSHLAPAPTPHFTRFGDRRAGVYRKSVAIGDLRSVPRRRAGENGENGGSTRSGERRG